MEKVGLCSRSFRSDRQVFLKIKSSAYIDKTPLKCGEITSIYMTGCCRTPIRILDKEKSNKQYKKRNMPIWIQLFFWYLSYRMDWKLWNRPQLAIKKNFWKMEEIYLWRGQIVWDEISVLWWNLADLHFTSNGEFDKHLILKRIFNRIKKPFLYRERT